MPQLVWTARPDGYCDYVSSQWVQYCGVTEEQLYGEGRFQAVHPEDREQVLTAYRGCIATGNNYETEYRLRRHDGLYRWFKARGVPVRDARNGIMQWLGTATDIDDQKQTENELRKANASLEEFAYVTSHDLQEPLRMVNLYTQLLLRQLGSPDETAVEFAGYVQSGVRRMQRLIDDLLSFSRAERVDWESNATADLQAALADAASVLRGRLDEAGGTFEVTTPLPTVPGEQSRFAQVFQNLLANSIKYRRPGVAPHIIVSAEREADDWVISVADNGQGFDPRYAERIFGLFKRLHGRDVEGTGIGLAVCRKLIERLGGSIWADGRPGQGATFRFRVPAGTANAGSAIVVSV
jgi:PAS domain S-box-containing protein